MAWCQIDHDKYTGIHPLSNIWERGMIEVTLHPKIILIGQKNQVVLRLFNTGPGTCLDLRLEFRFSPEIFVVRNGKRIDCEFIEEGKWYSREITVITHQIGDFVLASESFSYEDRQGIHKEMFLISIQAVSAIQPTTLQTKLEEVTPTVGSFSKTTHPNKVNLHNNLRDYFSLSDLKDITFELDVNYESLDHTRLDEFTRDLVRYCERHGLLEKLVQICQVKRPHVHWG